MLIKTIHLENFKKFSHLIINCEKQNILIGLNNAGKSTTLDALRIVHDVLRFASRRKPILKTFEGDVCASYELGHSLILHLLEPIRLSYLLLQHLVDTVY